MSASALPSISKEDDAKLLEPYTYLSEVEEATFLC